MILRPYFESCPFSLRHLCIFKTRKLIMIYHTNDNSKRCSVVQIIPLPIQILEKIFFLVSLRDEDPTWQKNLQSKGRVGGSVQ